MKKILLTLAATAMCTGAFAGERILYQQNFEQVADAAAAGWSYGAAMSIASDEYGKFLELNNNGGNGRSGQVTWGAEIYKDADGSSLLTDGKYNLSFDFSIKTMSNNQYNSEITVFTNHAPIANNTYRTPWTKPLGPWDNFVFDMSQCNTAADADMLATVNAPLVATTADDGTVSYKIATEPAYTFATGMWYTVDLAIDVNERTVEYTVVSLTNDIVTSGTLTVPEVNPAAAEGEEPISMLAEGLFVLTARYTCTIDIDNIKISIDTDYDVANAPAMALTRLGKTADDELNLKLRAYTISFLDGETLHVVGTDGQETTVEYGDCEGAYVYETTTSGTLKAWTTCGTATSEVVEETVDCTPVVLPEVTATISSVTEGYGKTYTLSVSNADVPLQPTIFIDYEFKGVNGETISKQGEASGTKVTVSEAGTLTVTSAAYGYESKSVSVQNDIEFATKQVWDFARMTDEDIKAAGFPEYQILNSDKTSGFDNWTARKRLYYLLAGSEHENDEGAIVYDNVYPFGFVTAENEDNVIYYTELDVEGEVATNVAGYELFPGLNVFAGHNVSYLKHIGVYNNATSGGNNKNIDVLNLDETDFVVSNKINNYGGNSNHPICATNDEYYAQLQGEDEVYSVAANGVFNEETGKYTVSCPVYRIDTACTKITVYKQAGSGVEGVASEVKGDNYYYTIDGLRLTQPTHPGLYIHNGKKVIIK